MSEIERFIDNWASRFGCIAVHAGQLNALCEELHLLVYQRGAVSQHSQESRVGKFLGKQDGAVFGEWRIRVRPGRKTEYWLEPAK